MGTEVARRVLSLTGYLLYTLVVLVGLLWLLFPAQSVRDWLESQLEEQTPHFSWNIGSAGLALPDGLVLTDVQMIPVKGKTAVLTLDRVAVAPVVESLFGKDKTVKVNLHLLEGDIRARVLIDSGVQQFTCRGTLEGLQPAKFKFVQQSLQRTFDGILAGTFSGKGRWNTITRTQLQGELQLSSGTLHFREPVLGLSALPYTKIKTGFKRRKGQWLFEEGTLQSPLMSGSFSGSVQVGQSPAAVRLQFTGALTPRSEMFAGLKNPKLAKVVRTHLKDGGLPFTVNGTVLEPGIRFGGELSRALKGLKRSSNQP